MAGESTAVQDMLRIEEAATSKIREQVKEVLEELKEQRKEGEKHNELMKDMIREYDRLSGRVSIQLQALVKVTNDLKQV